ncbi:MAG: sigma 54-interacting transcriptional regulator, partial [Candidatus Hodarchaeota archaeon]
PFVIINCAAIPRELIESELFGHEKGAFTGAHKQKLGKLEIAGDGTVFFDEIGNLPLELQGKFLRVLQEKSFERVGGTATIPTNARFIFATNQDLKKAIIDDKFREDLYYRINVFPIKLPPLRERKEDIPILVEYFIKKYNQEQKKNMQRATPEVMDCFLCYPWSGNIRQLENEIQKIMTLASFDLTTITLNLISEDIREFSTKEKVFDENKGLLNDALESLERRMIGEALRKFNGNITKAAMYLGISRRGLHKKLNRFGSLIKK